MDIAKLIVHQARAREQEPAIVFSGGVATYGVLARAVLAISERLPHLGLPRGAIVGVDVRNPFQHVALVIALELQGIASAAVQTAFSVRESGLRPAAILTDGVTKHDESVRLIPIDADWFVIDTKAPRVFERLMAMPGFGDERAVVRIVFSSGTTGVPKSTGLTTEIVMRRFAHNLLSTGAGNVSGIRLATLMGFSTLAGYMLPTMVLSAGGAICFGGNALDMLHLIRTFRVDAMVAAVGHVNAMLNVLGDARPPGIGTIIAMGSKIPQALLAQAQARLCANIMLAYGSTEAGAISQAPASLLEGLDGGAGFLLPWVTLEVVDGDDRPLPRGEEGIFRVRTDEQAYYVVDDPENSAFFRDGWFYPGDVGRVRSDGLVQVTGRSIEVINRGGSVIAPDLIERVLTERAGITDAAAFGVPSQTGLEDIWAAVVASDPFDAEATLRYCRERLADKAPSVIRRVASIPRTETGKIRRRQIRDELAPT